MIGRIVLAVVIAAFIGIVCIFVGAILVTLTVPVAVTIGDLLQKWGWILGVLAGFWYFFGGGFNFPTVSPPPKQ